MARPSIQQVYHRAVAALRRTAHPSTITILAADLSHFGVLYYSILPSARLPFPLLRSSVIVETQERPKDIKRENCYCRYRPLHHTLSHLGSSSHHFTRLKFPLQVVTNVLAQQKITQMMFLEPSGRTDSRKFSATDACMGNHHCQRSH